MSYLFPFLRYQTKCVIKFLFRPLVTSQTLRFIFHQPLKQWLRGRKRAEDGNTKSEYLENKKSFLDEIKNIFHSFWRPIIWWEIKIWLKIPDTSFYLHSLIFVARGILSPNMIILLDCLLLSLLFVLFKEFLYGRSPGTTIFLGTGFPGIHLWLQKVWWMILYLV